ncbi:bacillithiol biosynthesis BshC [Bacillus toyonensis]
MLTEVAFKQRLHDLRERKFFRQELVAHLLEYNTKLQAGESTIQNVKALGDENTYVVIAGQQAGLLTGPLYTIHKVISILQLAKEKEESLGVKVVPVFWIAGEDHDMDEINHTFVTKNKKIKRLFFMTVIRKRRVLLSLNCLLKIVENGWKRFLKHTQKRILQRMYYDL